MVYAQRRPNQGHIAIGAHAFTVWLRAAFTWAVALQAHWFNPPDVWSQLLRHLQDVACGHTRCEGSSAATAEPLSDTKVLLAQLEAVCQANAMAQADEGAASSWEEYSD